VFPVPLGEAVEGNALFHLLAQDFDGSGEFLPLAGQEPLRLFLGIFQTGGIEDAFFTIIPYFGWWVPSTFGGHFLGINALLGLTAALR